MIASERHCVRVGADDGFNINGSWQVELVQAVYEAELFPRLHLHQRVFVFLACLAAYRAARLAMPSPHWPTRRRLYIDWAGREERIAGVHSWHFKNRSSHHRGHDHHRATGRHLPPASSESAAPRQASLTPPPGFSRCDTTTEFCCASINECIPQTAAPRLAALCMADPAGKLLHSGHCPGWLGAVAMPAVVAEMRRLSPAGKANPFIAAGSS
eukprot:SAG22_NODE_380_length_11402_cov_8.514154_8_plen_213_part_00